MIASASASASANPIRFGQVEVLPQQRQLRVNGAPAALGARAFDLLLALIEQRDRVVTKDELLDRVWPGLVVEEGNLKVQVSNLRKLIGARAIATIPARGYRFALSLDDDDAPALTATSNAKRVPDAGLPSFGGALIGRNDDLAALGQLLRQGRLVTLLGAGGIGKTRLALAAAQAAWVHSGAQVVWVDLSGVSADAQVPIALAQALALPVPDPAELLSALVHALAAQPGWLVLDNAEHVLPGVAALVQAALSAAPELTLLVTSQAALHLGAERVYRVGPLPVPGPDAAGTLTLADALDYGAIALFVERAQAVQHRFSLNAGNLAAVIAICRALDGLALAIELAAARVPLLGIDGLAQRLDERLRLLAGPGRLAPTRQQTLRAALDWSYGLLSPVEQTVFCRLGVFVGGFTLDLAAAACCDAELDAWDVIDILGTLVERSLVAVVDGGPSAQRVGPRYSLLDTPRAYALQWLDQSGHLSEQRRRHAHALREHARRQQALIWLEPETTWLARNAPEVDNLRAAMDWGAAHEPALAVALVGATFHLFSRLALMHENRQRADALLPLIDTLDLPTDDLADFLRAHSRHLRDSSITALHAAAQRAASLFRHSGNRHGLYQTLFSIASAFRGFEAQASAAAQEMAAIEHADWPPALRALGCIARSMAASAEQRMAESRAALEAALALAEPAGADRLSVVALMNLADLALLSDMPAEAVQRGQALIALLHRRRDQAQLPFVQCNLANAHLQLGDTASARQLLSQALAAMRRQQWTWLRAFGDVYALLAARQGRADDAARLIGWADAVRQQRGPRQPNEARCRDQAWQIASQVLQAADLAACLAAGAAMAPEAVVIATLGSPAAAQPG